ncbi:MAG: ankyrin repeat domain-containing protein, partial [Proteobacteria bacterium]|nr:ankyrin repeat domain-containing protein [Pseudomonadota bacterium]
SFLISVCVLECSYRGFAVEHTVEGFADCIIIIFLMQDGFTPMYFAAKNNHLRLVELLLAHGADINKVQLCVM